MLLSRCVLKQRALLRVTTQHVRCLSSLKTASAGSDAYARTDAFARRHIGSTDAEQQSMLQTLGFSSLDALIDATVPSEIRLPSKLDLPQAMSESEATATLEHMAAKNKVLKSFIGQGYSDCLTPPPIVRGILENPGWYTSYTPYQAEVSQGRLEMLLNFQTMITELTGLAYSNASLLDEATAAAEVMTLARGATMGKRSAFFVASDCHPQTIGVMQTRASHVGIELVVGNPQTGLPLDAATNKFSGVLLQYPSTFGDIRDYRDFTAAAHKKGLLVAAAVDMMALTKLVPPGELGIDVAVGSTQRFGVPMMFGGPHAAFMATTAKHYRKLPGRIIGVSKDAQGKPAYRMAMQTREQHIRRDKATSNICTAQAMLANMAAAYAIYHGPDGIAQIADRMQLYAATLATAVSQWTRCSVRNSTFFDTLDIDVSGTGLSAQQVVERAAEYGLNVRHIDNKRIGVSMGETVDIADLAKLLQALGSETIGSDDKSIAMLRDLEAKARALQSNSIPASLQRKSPYLEHAIFNSYHSETEFMRYLKSLEDKDLALNRSMISLGSCTMKLNAVSELKPITWDTFMHIHPFAPRDQTQGYRELVTTLNARLAEITGMSAVTTQPNSGAAGEYTGLSVIRHYQQSIGQSHRDVCLIPVSAHGTNPASAVMAGMRVVVVKSDANGNIDRIDLEAKVLEHASNLSAFMITYPSTFGMFEDGVMDMCALVHAHGGQVYMDGANMNAQVALCNPGRIGADVCHLNLHKTFAIPHGGGGPGVGSIAVAKHLAPYLPGHIVQPCGGEGEQTVEKSEHAVSAAPFGSAGILPISWMYIHMLGEAGLRKATQTAILNANYMAKTLESHYDVVYRGKNGTCAHEFILDIRPFKDLGIVEEDIAKRLQDFGFHGPTMSWPVPGTLMIEPTESESKAELDRFCQAMITIRQEIEDIRTGKMLVSESPLKHAPHTIDVVCAPEWERKYSRQQAAFPAPWQNGGRNKSYWPSVGRVDNVFGDRHLVCSCPPLEDYE